MAALLKIAVKFFFDHFVYKFGGQDILQCFGGPIGARLTMCIARLVMQEWWDCFKEILDRSNIEQKLRAIYVDDGRLVIRKLGIGVRFNKENMIFEMKDEWAKEDTENEITANVLVRYTGGVLVYCGSGDARQGYKIPLYLYS